MYGYQKTVRLCLLEYLIVVLAHTLYGYFKFGAEKGLFVLLVSSACLGTSFILSLFVKNEIFVVDFIYFTVAVATTLIGSALGTLGYSVLIFLGMTAGLTIFMERKYIIFAAIVSSIAFIIYPIFLRDKLYESISSLYMYILFCVVYLAASVNLYIIVRYSREYMKGMKEKAEEAERANNSKMMFLANMSHEIRTPMNAICGMAEINLREELSPQVRENTISIQNSGKILLSIVNDILDYSKMENGSMVIVPVHYSLSHLIEETINIMQIRLEDKDVELKYYISDKVPDVLYGDEIRIRQILFNLLSNAIKFTDNGYILVNVDCEFLDGERVRLLVTVTDSGIGIRKEELSKLFISFQQLDSHKSHQREGTGLGLAICKELVSLMDGDISVESTYGVGSKFSFNIIQKISNKKEKPLYSSSDSKASGLETSNAKVLVVDDNAVNLKVAQGLLRSFGLNVDACKSGRECLDILKVNKDYDLIFLDHMMPELDGIETLNLIRADMDPYMQNVPVVALTANVMSGVREMFIAEGFNDYVPKPIDMVWVTSILRKYIPTEKLS